MIMDAGGCWVVAGGPPIVVGVVGGDHGAGLLHEGQHGLQVRQEVALGGGYGMV